MSGRMNWHRAHLHGKPSLDYRYEHEVPDRAARWLQAVERRQAQRRPQPRERRGFIGSTQVSSAWGA
jgi:hypothetical protein